MVCQSGTLRHRHQRVGRFWVGEFRRVHDYATWQLLCPLVSTGSSVTLDRPPQDRRPALGRIVIHRRDEQGRQPGRWPTLAELPLFEKGRPPLDSHVELAEEQRIGDLLFLPF